MDPESSNNQGSNRAGESSPSTTDPVTSDDPTASTKNGPALKAIHALVNNRPVGKGVLDAITNGETAVEHKDLIAAIHASCTWAWTNPILTQQVYQMNSRRLLVNSYNKESGAIDSMPQDKLMECFLSLSLLVIETMLEVEEKGNESHKETLLQGRPPQNHISACLREWKNRSYSLPKVHMTTNRSKEWY